MKGALASNWVVESAQATPDGFSLTGSSKGYTRFSKAFKSGAKVFYSAHDESGNREAGWATVKGNVLENRTPTATLFKGVYTETGPSKLSFPDGVTIACTFNAIAFDTIWDHVFREDNPHNVTAPQVGLEPALEPLEGQNVQEALEFLFGQLSEHGGAGMVISDSEPSDPVEGMQWLDSTSAEVWIWDGEKWLEFPAGSGSGASVKIEERPPSDPEIGDVWTDYGTTGELYIWDGRFWVSMTGDGGPKIIVGGEGGGDIDLPENITFDNLEDPEHADKALARHISSSGAGKWLPIKTGDVETDPEVTFRDAKGRFKSTKKYEDLTDQLKVNRFLAGEIESQGETLEQTNAGLVRIDNQVAENTSNIIQLQDSVGNIDFPEYDDSELRALIEELPVTVSTEPPEITKDGELWYDDERLELFISYNDGWISTTPLAARVEAGEALQAEILARVEAGEAKQATIVEAVDDGVREQTQLRSRIGDLESNSATKGDLDNYLPLKGGTNNKMQGNLYMADHFIAGLSEPSAKDHAATKEYADSKVSKEGNNDVTRNWRINHDGKNFIFFHDEGHLQLHHLAEPNLPHEAATKTYADEKLAKTGGTLTGQLKLKRTDDVSYWNYISSETPNAWHKEQKNHGLILKVGTTNSFKQQFKITGRSNKDLFKIYDDGKAQATFYGNLNATEIKKDGKTVATEQYVTDAISVAPSTSVQPVWKKISTSGFGPGCLSLSVYGTSTEIWIHAKSANGFELAHPAGAANNNLNRTNIRWPIGVFKDTDGKREWCLSGTAWSVEFLEQGESMYYKIKVKNEDDLIVSRRTYFDGQEVGVIFPPII